MKVKNFGISNTWVSIINPSGSLMHNQSGTVMVNINASGLVPKTYQCSLIARDLYNNKVVIPVTLHVSWPVAISDPVATEGCGLKGNFPNPFSGETQIRFDLAAPRDVLLEIYSLHGMLLRTWFFAASHAGDHFQIWDGKDDHGHPLPSGVYTCRMKTNDYQGSLKLILIR